MTHFSDSSDVLRRNVSPLLSGSCRCKRATTTAANTGTKTQSPIGPHGALHSTPFKNWTLRTI
jgi:hypothetical protein